MSKNNYEQEIDMEIEKRLTEMEKDNYEFAERFALKNYISVAVVAVVGIALIVLGANM